MAQAFQTTPQPTARRWPQILLFVLLVALFILVPPYVQQPTTAAATTDIIATTLFHPLANAIPLLLPLFKLLLLLGAVVLPLVVPPMRSGQVLLGYYATILLIISIFQNTARTAEYGFTWLIGNTLVQLIVAGFCLYAVAQNLTQIDRDSLRKERLWLVVLMALAFFMPYVIDSAGHVAASPARALLNEAGLTYCMVTPVVLGMQLLFPGRVHKRTLRIMAFVAFLFALANMLMWFVVRQADWWMGVLHLPLLTTGIFGMIAARKGAPGGATEPLIQSAA